MMKARLKELLALAMIGDGTLCMLYPEKHLRMWKIGPDPLDETVEELANRKTMTRALGAFGVAAGIWLASRQYHQIDK